MLTIMKYILCMFFIFCCLLTVNAAPEYYFKQISLKDGLSEATVKCALTDHKGVIWIGTRFGLNSFDRERVVNYYYDKRDTYSIPDNDICFLAEDSLLNYGLRQYRDWLYIIREKDCLCLYLLKDIH